MAKNKQSAAEVLAPEKNVNGTNLPVVLDQEFVAPANVRVKKHVTIPVLKWPENTSIVFMVVEAMKKGKNIEKEEDSKRGPRKEVDILTIASPSGELRQIVCGKVFKTQLEENYPKASYVEKWFMATKIAPSPERVEAARAKGMSAYSTYSIQEIEKP